MDCDKVGRFFGTLCIMLTSHDVADYKMFIFCLHIIRKCIIRNLHYKIDKHSFTSQHHLFIHYAYRYAKIVMYKNNSL